MILVLLVVLLVALLITRPRIDATLGNVVLIILALLIVLWLVGALR